MSYLWDTLYIGEAESLHARVHEAEAGEIGGQKHFEGKWQRLTIRSAR